MNSVTHVLKKSVVATFYVEHVIIILILLLGAFGFMKAAEHIALAEYFVSSPSGMVIPFVFWVLVGLRIVIFNREIMTRSSYQFLWILRSLESFQLFRCFVQLAAMQLGPILGYGLFLILIGIRKGAGSVTFLIATGLTVIVFAVGYASMQILIRPQPVTSHRFSVPRWHQWKKPAVSFFPLWLINVAWLVYLFCITLSYFILAGAGYLYAFSDYDYRLYAFAALAVSVVMFQSTVARFSFESQFSFFRTLPISNAKRFIELVGSTALMVVPAFVALVRNKPDQLSWLTLVELGALIIVLQLFWYSLLLINGKSAEQSLPNVFFSGLLVFVMLLSKVNLVLLICSLLLTAYLLYRKYYPKYVWVPDRNLP
jgi:hypothetical protein